MPEETVRVGGREYEIVCQEGEERFLHNAAAVLDAEAQALADGAGRMTESRTLLMAGLMLADRMSGLEQRVRDAEALCEEMGAEMEGLRAAQRVEVPTVPQDVLDALREIALKSEATAAELERRAAAAE